MKKILTVFLSIVMIFTFTFGLTACGEDDSEKITDGGQEQTPPAEENLTPTEGLEYEEIISDGEVVAYSVIGIGTATDSKIVIPSTYNDKPVTAIGEWAFFECDNITSVSISAGVKSIGDIAFGLCTSLKSLNLGGVTTIGLSAFFSCTSLENLIIPNGLKTIGGSAFYGCSGLKSVSISATVTNIELGAFGYCDSLTSITVATGNSKYHSSGNCIIETQSKTLITGCKNSVIPSDGSVTAIGEYAFGDSSSLTSITIPKNITRICDYAFYVGGDPFEDSSNLKDIYYKGTKAQWEAIEKGIEWDGGIDNYTIHCTDGDISKK